MYYVWCGLNVCGVVQGQSCDCEKEDADQAGCRADPVPLVQCAQPEVAALSTLSCVGGGGGGCGWH